MASLAKYDTEKGASGGGGGSGTPTGYTYLYSYSSSGPVPRSTASTHHINPGADRVYMIVGSPDEVPPTFDPTDQASAVALQQSAMTVGEIAAFAPGYGSLRASGMVYTPDMLAGYDAYPIFYGSADTTYSPQDSTFGIYSDAEGTVPIFEFTVSMTSDPLVAPTVSKLTMPDGTVQVYTAGFDENGPDIDYTVNPGGLTGTSTVTEGSATIEGATWGQMLTATATQGARTDSCTFPAPTGEYPVTPSTIAASAIATTKFVVNTSPLTINGSGIIGLNCQFGQGNNDATVKALTSTTAEITPDPDGDYSGDNPLYIYLRAMTGATRGNSRDCEFVCVPVTVT